MWPIVVRDEQRMYFLTNSHIEPFSFESSVELKFNKKRELCVRNEKKKKKIYRSDLRTNSIPVSMKTIPEGSRKPFTKKTT